ncbi:LysR family transcriptional regulator [Alteromonas sp. CYL-A6]|uniref:LysR family transcriptional regulator n=1 Tax=Alteromonas nitratireducens TaxID=3390813 RepID=UPI0034BDFC65
MHHLNYHHLYYFYITAREGSVVRAARFLHVTSQTVSGQLSQFERNLGYPLFDRIGKRLHLNSKGKQVFHHAEDIFQKGHELAKLLQSDSQDMADEFVIGLTDAIPKVLAFDFLSEVIRYSPQTRFIFRESTFSDLISDMAVNRIDLVLADHGIAPGTQIDAISYFLGESHLSFFSTPERADALKATFPASLNDEPLLMPGKKSGIVQGLRSWLEGQQIYPRVVAEFDDSALLKLFGSEGFGAFCAPSSISAHVAQQYQVECIGEATELTERYFAVSRSNSVNADMVEKIVHAAQALLA